MVTGTFFFVITGIAMIRFPDFYNRLHAGSKCLTTGGISILLGLIILEGLTFTSLRLVLIIGFLLITNPITAHAIARAGYYFGVEPKNLIKDELKEIGEQK